MPPRSELHPTLRQLHQVQEAIDRGVVEAAIDAHVEFFGPSAVRFLQMRPPRKSVAQ